MLDQPPSRGVEGRFAHATGILHGLVVRYPDSQFIGSTSAWSFCGAWVERRSYPFSWRNRFNAPAASEALG